MTKILVGWVFLFSISGTAFAKDEKIENRFEKHQNKFKEAALRACRNDLNATVIDFFSRKILDPHNMPVRIPISVDETPHAKSVDIMVNGTLMRMDLSSTSGDPTDAIRYLELVKSHAVDERVLEVRKFGLKVFNHRMEAVRKGRALTNDEINRFAMLLYHSVRDIYYGAEVGSDPLAESLQWIFLNDLLNDHALHQFISAILGNVDIRDAFRANHYFNQLILRWRNDRNHLGMSSPFDQNIVTNLSRLDDLE